MCLGREMDVKEAVDDEQALDLLEDGWPKYSECVPDYFSYKNSPDIGNPSNPPKQTCGCIPASWGAAGCCDHTSSCGSSLPGVGGGRSTCRDTRYRELLT